MDKSRSSRREKSGSRKENERDANRTKRSTKGSSVKKDRSIGSTLAAAKSHKEHPASPLLDPEKDRLSALASATLARIEKRRREAEVAKEVDAVAAEVYETNLALEKQKRTAKRAKLSAKSSYTTSKGSSAASSAASSRSDSVASLGEPPATPAPVHHVEAGRDEPALLSSPLPTGASSILAGKSTTPARERDESKSWLMGKEKKARLAVEAELRARDDVIEELATTLERVRAEWRSDCEKLAEVSADNGVLAGEVERLAGELERAMAKLRAHEKAREAAEREEERERRLHPRFSFCPEYGHYSPLRK
eukprot:CAMPEP_0170740174 /NCGR_PEP_ID=MMETSP0437-20130122/5544_1 /TAXON_ID=0 /ORGANISM="Sexangularia sp." /LENGTH=307 /DNA_ID=CAMNT_0011078659 /DNA_START=77 /DNA_END=1000 /DNA_ORIENTATION=-